MDTLIPVTPSAEFEQLRPLDPLVFDNHTSKDFEKALKRFRYKLHPGYQVFTHAQENVIISIVEFDDRLYMFRRDKFITVGKKGKVQGVGKYAAHLLSINPKLQSDELADALRDKFPTCQAGKGSGAFYKAIHRKLTGVEAYVNAINGALATALPIPDMPVKLQTVHASIWNQVVREFAFAIGGPDQDGPDSNRELVDTLISIIRSKIPHLNTTDKAAQGYGWADYVPGSKE